MEKFLFFLLFLAPVLFSLTSLHELYHIIIYKLQGYKPRIYLIPEFTSRRYFGFIPGIRFGRFSEVGQIELPKWQEGLVYLMPVIIETIIFSISFSLYIIYGPIKIDWLNILTLMFILGNLFDAAKNLFQSFFPKFWILDTNKVIEAWEAPRILFNILGILYLISFILFVWFIFHFNFI